MAADPTVAAAIAGISNAESWNRRVALIRQIPEEFGKARHQEIYSEIAEAVYIGDLAPDFAYIHWRDEYELAAIERAYDEATALTKMFTDVQIGTLEVVITTAPETTRIFGCFSALLPRSSPQPASSRPLSWVVNRSPMAW